MAVRRKCRLVPRREFYRRREFSPALRRFHGLGYFAGRVFGWGSGTRYGNRAYLAIVFWRFAE